MTIRSRQLGVLQAACGIAVSVIAMLSYFVTPRLVWKMNNRNWLVMLAYEGRGRVFYFHSPLDAFSIDLESEPEVIEIRSHSEGALLPPEVAGPPEPPRFRRLISIGTSHRLSAFGGMWRRNLFPYFLRFPRMDLSPWQPRVESSFVRFPLGLLVILLLYVPVRTIFIDRRTTRRLRQNRCIGCGYLLTGLTAGRCPECGIQCNSEERSEKFERSTGGAG